MRKDRKSAQFRAPLMSAFRDAFGARDAKKRAFSVVDGERVIPGRHSSQRKGDEAALKRDLTTDLLALLNTIDLGSVIDLTDLSHVQNSILNYGLPDVSGLTSEEQRVSVIADDLAKCLKQFEPRLNPETLHIEREQEFDDVNQRVRFSVSVEMFCSPTDVPIDFVAEIDIGSGKIHLMRLPGMA